MWKDLDLPHVGDALIPTAELVYVGWMHGTEADGELVPGGWVVDPKETRGRALPGMGVVETEWGPMWRKSALQISVMAWRRDWFTGDKDRPTPIPDPGPGSWSRVRVLAYVADFEDAVVISVAHTAARDLYRWLEGCYSRVVLGRLATLTESTIAPSVFWLRATGDLSVKMPSRTPDREYWYLTPPRLDLPHARLLPPLMQSGDVNSWTERIMAMTEREWRAWAAPRLVEQEVIDKLAGYSELIGQFRAAAPLQRIAPRRSKAPRRRGAGPSAGMDVATAAPYEAFYDWANRHGLGRDPRIVEIGTRVMTRYLTVDEAIEEAKRTVGFRS